MLIPDEQWAKLCPLLPDYKKSSKGGRPRLNKRKILEGIMYVSKHKIPWKAVPKVYGSGTALNDYFREWARGGVFHRIKDQNWVLVLDLDWEKINFLRGSSDPKPLAKCPSQPIDYPQEVQL